MPYDIKFKATEIKATKANITFKVPETRTFDVYCPQTKKKVKVNGTVKNMIYPEILKILHVVSCPFIKCPDRFKRDCVVHHDVQGNW